LNAARDSEVVEVVSEYEIIVPFSLDPEVKSRIKVSFKEAVRTIQDAGDEAECTYIDTQIESKLKSLDQSAVLWVRQLSRSSRVLHNLYSAIQSSHENSQLRITRALQVKIVAALFYLTNPFDVIPDYVPGTGYADDALVVNLVVSALEKKNPGGLKEFDSDLA
jgi:uncharacterized membrane protein YkvA (DUF1232 family)